MKTIFTALLLFASFVLSAQNFVPNGDFELHSGLPSSWAQWNLCNNWTNAGGTQVGGFFADPDYFHTNGTGPVNLPNAAPAQVQAYTGDAVMGFLGYHDPAGGAVNVREYLQVELTAPLFVGEEYNISFWITNGFSQIGHYYSCDGIGVNLSTAPLSQTGNSYIDRPPLLEVQGEIWETFWSNKSFLFTADSAYRYLTIGNFYPDSSTNRTVQISGPAPFAGAYYFIDQVSLVVSVSSREEANDDHLVSVYPNPAEDLVKIEVHEWLVDGADYHLYGVDGRLLRSGHFSSSTQVDLEGLAPGMYLLEVLGEDLRSTQRLVKN